MTITAKTDGKAGRFLAAAGARVRESLAPTNQTIGEIYRSAIRTEATKVSGRLAESFETRGVTANGGKVESDLPYAGVEERRKGFIARAVERSRRAIEAAMRRGLEAAHARAKQDAGG